MKNETLTSWAKPLWNRFLNLPSDFGLIGGTIEQEVTFYGQEFDYVVALFPLSEFQSLKHFFFFTLFLEYHEVNLLHGLQTKFVARPMEEAVNEMASWPGEAISAGQLLEQLDQQNFPRETLIKWVSQRRLEECQAFVAKGLCSYIGRCSEGYFHIFVW